VDVTETMIRMTKLNWAELVHPDDLEKDITQFSRLIAGEINSYSLEKRFTRKDGEAIHAFISVTCILDKDGSANHVLAFLNNISIQKKSEMDLANQYSLLYNMVDNGCNNIQGYLYRRPIPSNEMEDA
jgi:hypothetical protein